MSAPASADSNCWKNSPPKARGKRPFTATRSPGRKPPSALGTPSICPVHSPLGSVAGIDMLNQTIDIKKRRDTVDVHPCGGVRLRQTHLRQCAEGISPGVGRMGSGPRHRRTGASTAQPATLLLGRPPRLSPPPQNGAPLRQAGGDGVGRGSKDRLAIGRRRPRGPGPARLRQDVQRRANDLRHGARREEGRRHRQ